MLRKVLLAAVLLCILGSLMSASAQGPEPNLTLGFQSEGSVGSDIALGRYLMDPAGNPIRDVEITFFIDADFMNTIDNIEIGTIKTDENGLALIRYTLKQEGERTITAEFVGNEIFDATKASEPLKVVPGPETYVEERPFRMPGANITMVAIVLVGVWGLYLIAVLRFWYISRDKAAAKVEEEASQ